MKYSRSEGPNIENCSLFHTLEMEDFKQMRRSIGFTILAIISIFNFAQADNQTQTQSQTQLQTMPAQKLEVNKRGTPVATLKGTGDQTTKEFQLKQGTATFDLLLDWEKRDPDLQPGEGKFEVVLIDEQGRNVESIIGTIGHFDGARTVQDCKNSKIQAQSYSTRTLDY